jgi:hypothetical protein
MTLNNIICLRVVSKTQSLRNSTDTRTGITSIFTTIWTSPLVPQRYLLSEVALLPIEIIIQITEYTKWMVDIKRHHM